MGEAAALVSALTWSGTSIALTSLSARTSPVVLSALRLATGSVVLLFLALALGRGGEIAGAPAWTIVAVVGSGFVGYGLGDTVYIRALAVLGVQRAFPSTMALFIALTVAGGVLLLGEPFSWGLPAGALLIGAGIYLVSAPQAGGRLVRAAPHPGLLGGNLLIVLVGLLWAAATLWLAAGKGDLGAIAAGSMRTPSGAVSLLVFAAFTQRPQLVAPFRDRKHIGAIVAAGLAGTAFGSLLYVYAVVTAGAARTAVLSATSPLLALPLAVVFLGERLTRRTGAGTVLCVAGIVLVVA